MIVEQRASGLKVLGDGCSCRKLAYEPDKFKPLLLAIKKTMTSKK